MWDTRSVELSIDLPVALADTVEEVRRRDPEYLQRVIRYGMARRAVYQALSRQIDPRSEPQPPSDLLTDPTA
jgi:hypothetical protein